MKTSLQNIGDPVLFPRMRFFLAWAVVVLFVPLALGAEVDVQMQRDGFSYTIQAPGLVIGPIDFGARVVIDGAPHDLLSTAGKPLGNQVLPAQAGPYGRVKAMISTVRFKELGVDLALRIERPEGAPCVLLAVGITNQGPRKVELQTLYPMKASPESRVPWEAPPRGQEWIVTGFGKETPDAPRRFSAQPLADVKKGTNYFEECAFYRKDGTGFLIGPVGDPIASIDTSLDATGLSSGSAMTGVSLTKGETRWGQQTGVFFESPNRAMRRWADWVAKTHGARTSLGALSGWRNSSSALDSADRVLTEVVEFSEASQRHLRPQAIVVDGGTEESAPPLKTPFPADLSRYPSLITKAGARPGLRLTCDDRDSSIAENRNLIQQASAMGFRMFDLVYQRGSPPQESGQTRFLQERRMAAEMRQEAGNAVYLLSHGVENKRAALGAWDANRSVPDADRAGLRPLIEELLWAFPLNRRWYALDNEFSLAAGLADAGPLAGRGMARTWLSMVGLSSGSAFTGDHWFLPKFTPYLRNFEILQPPASEETEVLDLGTAIEWPRLAGRVVRPWGEWIVALLWNPGKTEQKISLDMSRIGAKPGSRYAVWSFWRNAYLGVVEKKFTTGFLPSGAAEHLVFTPLPEDTAKPVLIGSNFHLYCGAAEIKNVTALESAIAVEFTDAGASEGNLVLYSKIRPDLAFATGCEVTGIESAGENAWKIDIHNRAFGSPQRLELTLQLPFYQRGWFWSLLGLLGASAGFGLWKYLLSLRALRALTQIRLLHEERARIARDLHDELGASLAQISMLGDRFVYSGEAPGGVIQRIQKNSKESLRRLDEIVWAVNPERDSIEHLATFLSKFAQEFLADSGIRFRSDIPDELPPCQLSSKFRHNLFLATREAFRNAVRHGRPASILLRISSSSHELRIDIEDDGSGFDPSTTGPSGHGLANLHTRMQTIGGHFSISSHPGQGCRISLTLPLHPIPPQ